MDGSKELSYAIAYIGGLTALGAAAWHFESLEVPLALAAGWSLIFGLMTTRFDALLLPAGAVGGATLLWLVAADFQGWGSDTGPITLLFIPLAAGCLLLPLMVPMGAGILLAQQRQRAANDDAPHGGGAQGR